MYRIVLKKKAKKFIDKRKMAKMDYSEMEFVYGEYTG